MCELTPQNIPDVNFNIMLCVRGLQTIIDVTSNKKTVKHSSYEHKFFLNKFFFFNWTLSCLEISVYEGAAYQGLPTVADTLS